MTWTIYINFRSPSQRGSTKNFALIGQAVSEKVFENGGRTDDGWTTDGRRLDGYTKSSPCEPSGSGELINEDNMTKLKKNTKKNKIYSVYIHNMNEYVSAL